MKKYDIRDIYAIDIHSHYNHGANFDVETNEFYKCDIDFLMSEYDNTNIKCGAFSSFASVSSKRKIVNENEIIEENEHLYNLTLENERVYQWVVVDPRCENTFIQAEKMLNSNKCIGIKIHPDGHGYGAKMLDYADKIFSFADDKKSVVLMHPSWPEYMPQFANKYPNMNLIIAHLGGIYQVNQAKYDNIFLDTSGFSSSNNNVIEKAVMEVGSEKILFGTDTYSCGFQRGRIEYARITDQDKENILYSNAKRLFKKIKF